MSSIVIKIGSLVIKSLSKPIASRIKQQAREHENFRSVCVKLAQGIHQWDMRFRLGLLQDTAAIERQIAREAAEAQAKRHKQNVATVKTEAQALTEEIKLREKSSDKPKDDTRKRPKIRPLSEGKAIDAGANFVSEAFLLVVAVGCIFGERFYSLRKESSRREDVAERLAELEGSERAARRALVDLEKEVLRLRAREAPEPPPGGHLIPKELYDLEQLEEQKLLTDGTWKSWSKDPDSPDSGQDLVAKRPSEGSKYQADIARTSISPVKPATSTDDQAESAKQHPKHITQSSA